MLIVREQPQPQDDSASLLPLKAAIVSAPLVGAIQGLRGKNPLVGMLVGGLGGAGVASLGTIAARKHVMMQAQEVARTPLIITNDAPSGMIAIAPAATTATPPRFSQGFENVYHAY